MSAAGYVGRIGGLAVALGVGAAVFTGGGIACAQPAGAGASSGSGTGGSGTTSGTDSESKASTESSADTETSKNAKTSKDAKTSDEPDADATSGKKRRHGILADILGGHRKDSTPDTSEPESTPDGSTEIPKQSTDDTTDAAETPQTGRHRLRVKPTVTTPSAAAETKIDTSASSKVAETPKFKAALSSPRVEAPKVATTISTLSTTQDSLESTTTEPVETATAARPLASFVQRLFDAFAGGSPSSPAAVSPMAWVVAAASRRELAAAAEETQDPTMYWNGYQVVPVGEPTIKSFYGEYTMVPAFPSIVQGEQDFNLVDSNGVTAATVHGLVTINPDLGFGNRLLQIVVTDVTYTADGVEVGVGAGDIPAPGSLFGSVSNGRAGTSYSALDNPGGEDVVTYKFVTARGGFNLNPDPFNLNFSSANFLFDNEGVNRPVYTKDGFYIKPMSDTTAWSAYAGYQPLFNAIQGAQTFGLYDEDSNELVGTFEGVVTVTSDFWGTTSEAILVTDDGGAGGLEAGEIPPTGTIYNIIYWTADPREYLLYYAKPAERPDADVFKTLLVDVKPSGRETVGELNLKFDGAAPPVRESLDVPGRKGTGYSFVPTSEKVYSGVNGLPPREAITQGYQQFDVFDSDGNYLGNVDADVNSQWDLAGNSSEAILITRVNDGDDGTEAGFVPPVGSVFNFKYSGTSGFGEAYYALPTESGKSKISYQIVTPFGGIPSTSNFDAAKGLDAYDYYSPFHGNQNLNLLSAAGAESGGLLSAF